MKSAKPLSNLPSSSTLTLACLTVLSAAASYYCYVRSQSRTKNQPPSHDAKQSDSITMPQGHHIDNPNDNTIASMDNRTNDKPETVTKVPIQIDVSQPFTDNSLQRIQNVNTITISYASTTGTCRNFAKILYESLQNVTHDYPNIKIQLCTVDELDWWDELLNYDQNEGVAGVDGSTSSGDNSVLLPPIAVFILPTWTGGTLPTQFSSLLTSLSDICHDWRVAPMPLRRTLGSSSGGSTPVVRRAYKSDTQTLQIACFGMGSSAYDTTTFCKPAKDVFKHLLKLGAWSLLKSQGKSVVGMGDDDAGDCNQVFEEWMGRVLNKIQEIMKVHGSCSSGLTVAKDTSKPECCKENGGSSGGGGGGGEIHITSCACQEEKSSHTDGCCSSKVDDVVDEGCYSDEDNIDNEDEDEDEDDDDSSAYESDYNEEKEPEVMDLEDIGNAMKSSDATGKSANNRELKEMVTPKQAAALKKEGYRIIGTHSAVKLCRWTKHQLRGRGGCYKHTFYGITSYQCMEATPSLACANKCVFCWRHHKNPVGREWRWKMDDPNEIVEQAIKEHISMIKEARGIPGVKKDRWQEAHTVRHCALSLVGEPIMYPRIDEFLADLHRRKISTFLVTNGQHPKAIESLRPITQLYVSVDASTPETLEAIDRPLFKDAWDRLKNSLKCLKDKGQRTVARLTVVKGWNSDEIEGYAKLIALGHCSLVEVKGVTFCGKSDASNLNMSNTPWHHEIVAMVKKLQQELQKIRDATPEGKEKIPEYGIACEHRHSVSVLLARVDQFAVDDPVTGKRRWRTWINYEKFQELTAKHEDDPSFTFGVKDYVEDTPSWALYGAEEEGFDPTDTRHRKKRKYPKYTKFDVDGVPTHDHDHQPLNEEERSKLRSLMELKKKEIGDGVSVIGLETGEKVIHDASLMFRGLTIRK